jgi:hypothetical protein
MKGILIDSGPLIALFDADDDYHQATKDFIQHNQKRLITSIASVTEVLHLLDFSRQAQIDFLGWVSAGALHIETIHVSDFARIQTLTQKYADLPMDFADACLVFLGEKLNISEIATIDRDFDVYRLHGTTPFTVLINH